MFILMNIISISRRRNNITTAIVKKISDADYNFDYRGNNSILLLLKAYITSKEIPESKIYFVEGILCFFVAYFLSFRFNKSKIIVYLNGPDLHPFLAKKQLGIKSKIKIALLRKADCFFVISEMLKNDLRLYLSNNIRVINCFAENLNCDKSLPFKKRSLKNIIFSADRPSETGWIKGLDIAIRLFEKIHERDKQFRLFIIGLSSNNLKIKHPGITLLGFVDPKQILVKMTYAIAPSRYDAANMFVIEALSFGVIPIVSDKVGLSLDLSKIDINLVGKLNEENSFINCLDNLQSMKLNKINKIKQALFEFSKRFTKENCLSNFELEIKKFTK
jgi:glycosyltransferase involved in cell wall biosynthesis